VAGPKIQMPAALSQMMQADEAGNITGVQPEWAQFFHQVQQICYLASRSGATSSRPTSTTDRFIGEPFYDTTLGLPVFLHSASTNVWHKADGTVA
jgi:hypothetical protein